MSTRDIVLVTGANTGLGYETVKKLFESSKPYHVLLGSRDPVKGQQAEEKLKAEVPGSSSTVEVLQIDVTADESVNKAFAHIKDKHGKLDVLVNNAGGQFDGTFEADAVNPREVFNKDLDVNVTSAHVVTLAATPLLLAASSPRLIFITSGTCSLTGNSTKLFPPYRPNPPGGWPKKNLTIMPGYRASKAAVNMLMLTWHWLLKEDGVKTFSVSPGFLATGLAGIGAENLAKMGAKDPALGGVLLRRVIEGERDGDVAKIVTQDGALQDW